jgi:hypothetical protein
MESRTAGKNEAEAAGIEPAKRFPSKPGEHPGERPSFRLALSASAECRRAGLLNSQVFLYDWT